MSENHHACFRAGNLLLSQRVQSVEYIAGAAGANLWKARAKNFRSALRGYAVFYVANRLVHLLKPLLLLRVLTPVGAWFEPPAKVFVEACFLLPSSWLFLLYLSIYPAKSYYGAFLALKFITFFNLINFFFSMVTCFGSLGNSLHFTLFIFNSFPLTSSSCSSLFVSDL